MKILFIGTSGVHHVQIAASLYLGRGIKEAFSSSSFANLALEKKGHPIFIGKYKGINEVYSLGVGYDIGLGEKILNQLRNLLGYTESDLIIIPIFIKNEQLIYFIIRLSMFLNLDYLYKTVTKFILKCEFNFIKEQVERRKLQMEP